MGLVEPGKPTRKIQASEADVRNALSHTKGAGMLELMVEGETKKHTVFVKQVDLQPTTRKILAANFSIVAKGETIVADVPVHAVGEPEAVKANTGVLVHSTSTVKLKGQPEHIPASLEVDISDLQVGGHINGGDLKLPPKTELLSSADATFFTVQPLRAAETEAVVEEIPVPAE